MHPTTGKPFRQPRIETIMAKTLAGTRLTMSLVANKTGELWRAFMPLRHLITNRLTTDLVSLQTYPQHYFEAFNPAIEFEKWALAEVADTANLPSGLLPFTLPGGLYAVFLHQGASTDTRTIQYIFTTWLPASGYELDDRPHFEVLGAHYRNDHPDSEEELWIPIRPRA
ncbi:GyrI-like domain-containing protein [Fibrella arboris]|uniref:GyrI-like domain-containing protein n=1 Tax=Fibrella arboris TaxID=3242486 RepID=UPI0035202F7B